LPLTADDPQRHDDQSPLLRYRGHRAMIKTTSFQKNSHYTRIS
jgi:hypothetical protein